MFETFYPILFLIFIATMLAVIFLFLSKFIGKKTKLGSKTTPYECGVDPVGTTKEPIQVKFYLVAILFILFDIEVIFLYPWAVSFIKYGRAEMIYTLIVAIIFILILVIGLLYEYKKGAFKWD